jgi:hypothetical protein
MKIIDRNEPINLIGGIYTKNNPVNGNEMIVEVVGILEHRVFHKDSIANYFILDILTSTKNIYLRLTDLELVLKKLIPKLHKVFGPDESFTSAEDLNNSKENHT